jgi:hypothetical protein
VPFGLVRAGGRSGRSGITAQETSLRRVAGRQPGRQPGRAAPELALDRIRVAASTHGGGTPPAHPVATAERPRVLIYTADGAEGAEVEKGLARATAPVGAAGKAEGQSGNDCPSCVWAITRQATAASSAGGANGATAESSDRQSAGTEKRGGPRGTRSRRVGSDWAPDGGSRRASATVPQDRPRFAPRTSDLVDRPPVGQGGCGPAPSDREMPARRGQDGPARRERCAREGYSFRRAGLRAPTLARAPIRSNDRSSIGFRDPEGRPDLRRFQGPAAMHAAAAAEGSRSPRWRGSLAVRVAALRAA